MAKVYLLQHESADEDVKTIGVYRSLDEAEAAIERARRLPGFRDEPDGFSIDAIQPGDDHWTSGYVRVEPDASAGSGAKAA